MHREELERFLSAEEIGESSGPRPGSILKRASMIATALIFGVAILFPVSGCAQMNAMPSVAFKLGDDFATVKAALHTTVDPEAMPRNAALPTYVPDPNKGKSFLHLRTKGIWAFFSSAGTVDTIRLDAPFAGDVMGVKLGDDAHKVMSALGNPISKPTTAVGVMQAYRYVLDDSAYVVFDINDEGVQYIFINK